MKTGMIACACTLAFSGAATAQDLYPAEGTSFLYGEYYATSSAPFPDPATFIDPVLPREILYKIEQTDGDQIAYASCAPSGTDCWHFIHRDLFFGQRKVFQDLPDPSVDRLTGIEDLEELVVIETKPIAGDRFFPLEDGKSLTWSEAWKAANWSVNYTMSVKQTCCYDNGFGVAPVGDLWRFDYTFEQLEASEGSGTATYYYDTGLKWFIGIETRQFQANQYTIARSVLKSVNAP